MKIINENSLESKRWTFAQGEASSRHIIDTPEISVSVSVIEPNSQLPDKPHVNKRHELLYVSAGSLQVSVEQETKTASRGDFIIFEPNEGHRLFTGKEQVTLFEVFWKEPG